MDQRLAKRYLYRNLIKITRLLWPRRENAGRIPVLCYHRILPQFNEAQSEMYYVTPEQFESQMALLQARGFRSLTLNEYAAIATGKRQAEERCVLVTFDDGYFDCYAVAREIAANYGVNLNLFVLTAEQDKPGPFLMVAETPAIRLHIRSFPELWRPLTWTELREMACAGVGIGLHGHRHSVFSELDDQTLDRQLTHAIGIFKRELGFKPVAFALPYGNRRAYNSAALQTLSSLDFEIVFSTIAGRSRLPAVDSPLSRLVVHQTDDLKSIEMKLFGAADIIGYCRRLFPVSTPLNKRMKQAFIAD